MSRKINYVSKAVDGTYSLTIKGNTMSVSDTEGNYGSRTFSDGEKFDVGKGFWNCFKQIKDSKRGIKIGDKVKIIDIEEIYDSYWKWFDDFEMAKRYQMFGNPSTICTYKIVAMGPHEEQEKDIVCAIEDEEGKIYLIRNQGIKKV